MTRIPVCSFLAAALVAAAAGPVAAQHGAAQSLVEFFPGGTYDPAVPTPEAVLGYAVGTFHTDYAGLERWIAALQRSQRVRVLRYGESIERRPLYLIVVSSPQNLARLDEIKAGMRRLADPRVTTEADADRLIRTIPAVAWLNHANDGNESAAFEAAIQTSYQLAAGTDPVTRLILERLVTIVNPAHNPESHERFVAWYNSAQVGRLGTPDPQAAEHHAPWGMSTNNNHYQIDLNRDAFFVSQPETRAIVRAYAEWNPVLFIDHHGQTKNMFFPPPAEAVNLNVTQNQVDWMGRYGNAIGDAFDQRGWSYYRRGRFDLFYAGFWDSWPTLNGSVGLTFETDAGGNKGLAWEREDQTILSLRDGVARHHIGAMATLRVTAQDKDRRLRDFYEFKRSAIAEGQRERMRQVVLLPGRDEPRARELVRVLTDQQIEVYRATGPFRVARAHSYMGGGAGARTIPAGAYVIPMAQPQKRLAKAILEPEPAFKEEFLRDQEQRKRRAELLGRWSRDGFYDVTAWSLPLLFGVDAVWAEDAPPTRGLERVGGVTRGLIAAQSDGAIDASFRAHAPARGGYPSAARGARYGYLFSSENSGSMRLAAQLLSEGFNIAVATQPFRVLGADFPRGSILARVERNSVALHDRLAALAAENGVRVHALNSARVESGADFGEDPIVELKRPRIAVVTDEPTDERAYGATWFTLEQRLGMGFTALKIPQLKGGDLGRYNVIVLPHGVPGDYHELLGEQGIAKLRRWTQDGGTLVVMKGAAAFATRRGVEWTGSRLKRETMPVRLFFDDQRGPGTPERAGARAGSSGAGKRDTTADPLTREMDPIRTAGAILRVRVDPEHFLGFGHSGDVAATISGAYAFTISRDAHNAAAFPDERSLRIAGHMWPEAQRTLARSLYAWVEPAGRGQVILFADDPNFRATQLSTLRLFFNAVVLGPSFVSGR